MGELTHSAKILGKDAVVVTLLTGASLLAAKVIIQGNVVAGHMDASCASDPACETAVLEFVTKTLPSLALPLLYTLARIGRVVVYKCSTHPEGGQNKGFSARIE